MKNQNNQLEELLGEVCKKQEPLHMHFVRRETVLGINHRQ